MTLPELKLTARCYQADKPEAGQVEQFTGDIGYFYGVGEMTNTLKLHLFRFGRLGALPTSNVNFP